MKNTLRKNFMIVLIAVLALGFSVFFTACHSSLNEEDDNKHVETPGGEEEKPLDPSTQALGEAVFKLVVRGAEGDLNLAFGDVNLNGRVRASLDGAILGFADADLFGMKVSLGVQFADGNKNVLLEALGEKLYFDLADTAEVVERISALVEGREPVVPDIAAGETYPPVEIGGLDLGAIFSLLDNFDATSILGMLADTVGVETENGYEYNVPVLGDVAVKMSVDGNNDLTSLAVTGLAAGGTEAVIELNGISYPAQKPVPVSVEGYKNVKDYLPLLENFCKEKIDSVPQLIETIKKTDFGRLVETIKAVKEAGAVSFDVALNAGVKVTAKATVDFADGLTVALKATVSGNEIEVYYADGAFYLLKEGVSLKANAEDISALAALFGADIGDIDLGGLTLDSIGADNGVLQVRLGGLTLTLDVAALEAEINYNGYSAKVTGIAAGGRVNVPEIAWSELGNAVPLVENLFEKISDMTFGFSGTIDGAKKVTFTDVRVIDSGTDGIAQDFENGKISIAGRVTVDDGYVHNIDVVYKDNKLYVSYNDAMKLMMGKNSLDGIVKLLKDNLGFILDGFVKSDAISDLFETKDYGKLVSMLSRLTIEENKVSVAIDGSALGAGEITADVTLNEDLTVGLGLVMADMTLSAVLNDDVKEIAVPEDAAEYIDVSNIEYLLEGFLVTATKESRTFVMKGTVDVDIDAKILVSIKGTIKIGLEAYVRINEDGSVDAYVVFDNTNVAKKGSDSYESSTASLIHTLIKYGKTYITYHDDMLYIDRMDMEKSGNSFKGYQFEETQYRHMKLAAADCKGETMKNFLGEAFGLSSLITGMIPGEGGNEMQYEKIVKNYVSESRLKHSLVIATSVLAGSDMLGDLTADIFLDENMNITDVAAGLEIGLGSLGKVTANIAAKHYVEEGFDFEEVFEQIKNNEYTGFAA